MAIAEARLERWSKQGKTGQFTDTYKSFRTHLMDKSAIYPVTDCEVFLQGSYANSTNVWADSDVDIVLKHNGAFYFDISGLPQQEKQAFNVRFSSNASYGYFDFKADAEKWVNQLFSGVRLGNKAVSILGNNSRRDVDVLIAQQFRHYYSTTLGNYSFHEGLAFYANGRRIVNFPKQHIENCTAKHQATNQNFKRIVRVYKNLRNEMIETGFLAKGIAPSYFLEGMLYNVPNEIFSGTYTDMLVNCFNWLVQADRTKLTCANELHWLVRDGSPTSWPIANFTAFFGAARQFWEN
ncbi:hypothetical protein A7A08_00550 [Methyloligella halotolerans]|uniref:cGAS/DncV-like nucleotidyltransferase C-terminal helical domain-containing protein n=1 Tax=Methyloligella halotolerans TaxID=1177755 RepID=A0A1E2S311_9HYPH|nr:nucleotidyltransferase [Methyloligella halotolerans]ODA68718.1 hypothetical protein A7A08_00550 [Methyloligella halotolerans]